MKCDSCHEDFCIWTELSWNGRYKHADTLFRVHCYKQMTCAGCQQKVADYEASAKSVADMLNESQARREANGNWIAACGGSEQPMTVSGVRVLYCWNTGTKKHAYLNLDTDIIMQDGEFEALCGR